MQAQALIRTLGLTRHPEGGYYRETFRASALPFDLPGRGARSASTAIYFLLEDGDFSAFHRVRSDEVWHFYAGAPLELHTLGAEQAHERVVLGADIERGERPQHVVLAGVYQAARLAAPVFAPGGCPCAPVFDFAAFELPSGDELASLFEPQRELVKLLTRT